MAYFKNNESYPENDQQAEAPEEPEYDDGFDELTEEDFPELSEEEITEKKDSRLRLALGAGNLIAVIGGTVLILILLTMIIHIVYFVINDMSRNFSLFQTNF